MRAVGEGSVLLVRPALGGAHGRCLRCPGGHDVVGVDLDDVRDALVAHQVMVHAYRPLDKIAAAGEVVRRLT